MDLSVVIPYVNEHPQVLFTVQSLSLALRDQCDFEIVVVDNWCDEVEAQNRQRDCAHVALDRAAGYSPWIKHIAYPDRLSCWQARAAGVQAATADIVLFVDAHCVFTTESIIPAFRWYRDHADNCTCNIPYLYLLDSPSQRITYKPAWNIEVGNLDHRQTTYNGTELHEVPCSSVCGRLMTKQVLSRMGGFPPRLGIYGGGEHFLSYVAGILGITQYYYPTEGFYHLAAKRGYHWNSVDWVRNRAIATYLFGDAPWLERYLNHRPEADKEGFVYSMYCTVYNACYEQRQLIQTSQVMSIEDYIKQWEERSAYTSA